MGEKQEEIDRVLKNLAADFDIHRCDGTFYFGFRIMSQPDGIFIHQEALIKKLISKYQDDKYATALTPVVNESDEDDKSRLLDTSDYRQILGSL